MTSVCAVCFTVPVAAEIGRLMTKNTDPIAVTIRPAGRRTATSAMILAWSSEPARQGVTLAEETTSTMNAISILVFISLNVYADIGGVE
jgi:hypothetical protein